MTDIAEVQPKTFLDRVLGIAADVRAGEGLTAVLLATNGFLLLAAYYFIRPIRSALLLPIQVTLPSGTVVAGPEITSYLGAVLAGLFLLIVPLYGSLASKVNRIRLITYVTLFFVSNLIVFFLLGRAGVYPAAVAISFFLWIGIFNLMVIAQFWSFANDLYTPEQGRRLFAIVGFGGSVGAGVGALIASQLIRRIGLMPMMILAGAALLIALALSNLVHVRELRHATRRPDERKSVEQEPLGREGGFQLVLRQNYLLLIGLLTLTVQVVNTNGNYILNATLAQWARAAMASGESGGLSQADLIGSFMAGTDFYQNVLAMGIQFFLVSRIFKYLGIGGALFVLPLLALGSYGLFAAVPILTLIRTAKIVENATDYSLQNTVRRALFLPTSREAKYKALQAVETFFWRAGDMLSALTTFLVVQWLAMSVRGYAIVNLGLVVLWLLIALKLARENRQLTIQAERAAA